MTAPRLCSRTLTYLEAVRSIREYSQLGFLLMHRQVSRLSMPIQWPRVAHALESSQSYSDNFTRFLEIFAGGSLRSESNIATHILVSGRNAK